MNGVADVRYDRRWLERMNGVLALLRGLGGIVVAILGIGAAMTVMNIVRLASFARRHEIEVMELVGVPIMYVRAPFLMEGVIAGGIGALAALGILWSGFTYVRAEYGQVVARVLGVGDLAFLPLPICAALLAGGMAVGCVGGVVGLTSLIPHADR